MGRGWGHVQSATMDALREHECLNAVDITAWVFGNPAVCKGSPPSSAAQLASVRRALRTLRKGYFVVPLVRYQGATKKAPVYMRRSIALSLARDWIEKLGFAVFQEKEPSLAMFWYVIETDTEPDPWLRR